jgi:putative ATP-binding cassette transporter
MILLMALAVVVYSIATFPVKRNITLSKQKEATLLDRLNDVLAGFKEIKINRAKNEDLYSDYKRVAQEAEALKIRAMTRINDTFLLVSVAFLCLIGVIVFLLPLGDVIDNEHVVSIASSLLFLWGPMMMVLGIMPQFLLVSVSITTINRLTSLLRDVDVPIPDSAPKAPDFQSITLESVTFRYTGNTGDTLFQMGPVDFSFNKGEVIYIIGGNGSGKSTLMKILTGLYHPDDGTLSMDGQVVSPEGLAPYRELFSTVFTDFYLFKKLYGLEAVDADRVNRLLRTMGLDKKTVYRDNAFSDTNLSTGQRKRLAYLIGLLEDKSVYVFDEWAADQDPEFRKRFYTTFINDMRAMGKTVIAVSHDDRYFHTADRIVKMVEGKIVSDTTDNHEIEP